MAAIETIRRIPHNDRMEVAMRQHKTSIASVMSWIGSTLERHRTRRALLEMGDEQLKDIGISRADAYGEAYRPFWK